MPFAGLPGMLPGAGLKRLPAVLSVPPDELDPITVLAKHPVAGLFVAGGEDRVAPPRDVQQLFEVAAPGSRLITIADAAHETLPYRFDELAAPVIEWLDGVRTAR